MTPTTTTATIRIVVLLAVDPASSRSWSCPTVYGTAERGRTRGILQQKPGTRCFKREQGYQYVLKTASSSPRKAVPLLSWLQPGFELWTWWQHLVLYHDRHSQLGVHAIATTYLAAGLSSARRPTYGAGGVLLLEDGAPKLHSRDRVGAGSRSFSRLHAVGDHSGASLPFRCVVRRSPDPEAEAGPKAHSRRIAGGSMAKLIYP